MSVTNSFWREVLDYLPGLVMLFRIDEQENAQLMFVNEVISQQLGYKPEEFILASESVSHVQTQLEALVEDIANQSHGSEQENKLECTFYNKQGEVVLFQYEFQLLRIKSSKFPFIAVELHPAGKLPVSTGNTLPAIASTDEVIAKSTLMQAVLKQLDHLVEQSNHIVFRGEESSGKTNLARRLLKMISLLDVVVYEIDADDPEEQVLGAIDELGSIDASQKSALLIRHFHQLNKEAQHRLLKVIERTQQEQRYFRVVATSTVSLENLMEEGNLDTSLYYLMSFHPVLVPPLRKRQEDIAYCGREMLPRLAEQLAVRGAHVSESDINRMIKYDWPGNWRELQEVLRMSLANISSNGRIEIALGKGDEDEKQTSLFPEAANQKKEDILEYDEMNKLYLQRVLELTKGKVYGDDGAAHLLGLKPTTLQSKLKKLGIR